MTALTTTLSIDGVECDVEVRYSFTPASRGARDSIGGVRGAGPALQPDEPACVEIERVDTATKDILEYLSVGEILKLEHLCLEQESASYMDDL